MGAEARPPEDRDAAQEIARELAELAAQLGTIKGEATNWLTDPRYGPLLLSDIEGARGGYLVINMDDASQMPALSEPLFLGLGATIQSHPVMVPEDLEKAGADLEQLAQKYG